MTNSLTIRFAAKILAVGAFLAFSALIMPSFAAAYNGYPPYSYGSDYSYGSYYSPVIYQQPVYQTVPVYYPVPVYPSLSVNCYANTNYAQVGQPVTWSAQVSGGSGSYTFTWSGSDNLYGNGQSVSTRYNYPGAKNASVTVYSAGQTVTRYCSNNVSVTAPIIVQPVYTPIGVPVAYPQQGGLDIGCYADPISVSINQPVTWNTEVTGGIAPYRFSWSGSNDLSGSQSSIIKYYGTAGEKYAIVTVTSADGRTQSRACSNTVTVKKPVAAAAKPKPVVTAAPCNCQVVCCQPTQSQSTSYGSQASTQIPQTNTSPVVQLVPQTQTAASYLSLANVPWGWVSIFVIVVLFITVVYLLFNRQKI